MEILKIVKSLFLKPKLNVHIPPNVPQSIKNKNKKLVKSKQNHVIINFYLQNVLITVSYRESMLILSQDFLFVYDMFCTFFTVFSCFIVISASACCFSVCFFS